MKRALPNKTRKRGDSFSDADHDANEIIQAGDRGLLEDFSPTTTTSSFRHIRGLSGSLFVESLSSSSSRYADQEEQEQQQLESSTGSLFTAPTATSTQPLNLTSLGLYGRNESIQKLEEIFEASKTSRQMVFIAGEAGAGKSALAHHLRQSVLGAAGGASISRTDSGMIDASIRSEGTVEVAEEGETCSVLPNLFAAGKFDQLQRDEPYAGITAACNELCQVLLELRYEPKYADAFKSLQAKLFDAVGDSSHVLATTVVPKLQLILHPPAGDQERSEHEERHDDRDSNASEMPQPSNNATSNTLSSYLESKYIFTRSFLAFIRTVAWCAQSLVLTLDDLQWADQSSLELMEAILTDSERSTIMLVGIYRKDGVSESHSLAKFIRDVETPLANIGGAGGGGEGPSSSDLAPIAGAPRFSSNVVEIGDLEMDHIADLLGDLLNMGRGEVQTLAECVHKKTMGNAFFVKQFIRLLHARGLLRSIPSSLGQEATWTWDADVIKAETSATENVADLVTARLRGMSLGVRSLIPLVASLGAIFSRSFLQLIFERFGILMDVDEEREENFGPDDFLIECEQAGFICALKHGLFCWEHDKIQEAALSLVEPARRTPLQFQLGEVLLSRLGPMELDQHIFIVANLLGDSVWLAADDPRRIQAAQVLLKAGKKACKISAFELAAHYLGRGIDLLPPDVWESTNQETGLDLYSSAAEAEVCLGHFEKMQEYCDQILLLNLPLLDKRRVYTAMIRSCRAQAKLDISRLLCTKVLHELGLRIPKRGLGATSRTLISMLKLKLTSRRLLKRLASAETIKDEAMEWREELVNDLAVVFRQASPGLIPIVVMMGLQSIASYGISDCSAVTIISGGYMLVILGDYQGAKLYAEEGLSLLESSEREGVRRIEPRCLFIAYYFVLPWQLLLVDCVKGLLRGYRSGINIGDTETSGWCVYSYLEFAFQSGRDLGSIANECCIYFAQMNQLKQKKIAAFIWMIWDIVRTLSDDEVDEEVRQVIYGDYLEEKHFQVHHFRWLLVESFWQGDYDRFFALVEETQFDRGFYEKHSPGAAGLPTMYFHFAMASFIHAKDPALSKSVQSMLRALRQKFLRKINLNAKRGNPNVVHYKLLLDAEVAAMKKDHDVATRCYRAAIDRTRDMGFKNCEALAYERLSEYQVESGNAPEESAKRLNMGKAIQLYEENGMQVRARKLSRRYTQLFGPPPGSPIFLEINVT